MAKLSNTTTKKTKKAAPLKATVNKTRTYEGAKAYKLDTKSELFTLAISNMVGEDTFYESADARHERFVGLIKLVSENDPEWMQGFIPFLRQGMFMRTASVVAAAEYAACGAPNAPTVIASALQRADEPAEFLSYWMQNYYGWDTVEYPLPSPKLPQNVRKGLTKAVQNLYDEYSVMKYNGLSRGVSMGNVLNLVHPKPENDEQSRLFKYIIDRHHGNKLQLEGLPKIAEFNRLNAMSKTKRDEWVSTENLRAAGMTWESLSGWGAMGKKEWEAIIPLMGYMALLRNLRNFEQAGISKTYIKQVCDRLADPEQVRKSKQFPFRFMSAFEQVNNLAWLPALEAALDTSVENIPEFDGKTLVVVDISGSMGSGGFGRNSTMSPYKIGAIFGVALAYKCQGNASLVCFGTNSQEIDLPAGGSVLPQVKKIDQLYSSGRLGYSTNQWATVRKHYDDHDRVVIFTDEQSQDKASGLKNLKNVHTFNFGGYGRSQLDFGKKGRYLYGGFSDKTFTMMKLLEQTGSSSWPWEN